ncbi:MAG TPA: universal stress protein [Burkholderiaceae bacterium]|nr:universal stress protein [Burkholderiaceae bacterium]
MFTTILVPTDGSELSERAAHAAIEFARDCGAKVEVLAVWQSYPYSPYAEFGAVLDVEAYGKQMQAEAEQAAQRVADDAAEAGVPCTVHVVDSFSPYEEILKAVEQYHCDLVCMATHGRRGLGQLLLGSQTRLVTTHCPVPVLVYR